jgi:hypothetical protein
MERLTLRFQKDSRIDVRIVAIADARDWLHWGNLLSTKPAMQVRCLHNPELLKRSELHER